MRLQEPVNGPRARDRPGLQRRTSQRTGLIATGLVAAFACLAAVADPPRALSAGIPPQALATALFQFAAQTGVQVAFVSEIVEGKVTQGAAAGLVAKEALAALLAGTGLQYEYIDDRTIRLFQPPVQPRPEPPRAP